MRRPISLLLLLVLLAATAFAGRLADLPLTTSAPGATSKIYVLKDPNSNPDVGASEHLITISALLSGYLTQTAGDNRYSLIHGHPYEPALGNPAGNGYVLKSTTGGSRSWGLIDWLEVQSKPATFAPAMHNNTAHSETYLTATDLAPVTYDASAMNVIVGTVDGGTYADLDAVDGARVAVSEGTGAPAIDIRLTFPGVAEVNNVLLYGHYTGSAGHDVAIQIYNTVSTQWETVGYVVEGSVSVWHSFPLIDGTNYISGGTVLMRLYHTTAGNPSHDLFIDLAQVRFAASAQGGVTRHAALPDTADANMHPMTAITGLTAALGAKLEAESDPTVAGAISAHESNHPIPTNRDTRNQIAGSYATAAQGALADSAVQPEDTTAWDKDAANDLALGETNTTAYRGDRGKTAYDHSQAAHAPANAEQNVQSDWNAPSGDAHILNKPTIPATPGQVGAEPADPTLLKESELSAATNSTSTTTPASVAGVKAAYDLANSKQSPATTLAGYGITDAATSTQGAKADTAVQPPPTDGYAYAYKDGAWSQTMTVAEWLDRGGVLPARSDSAICDSEHSDYSAVNSFLAARGLNDTNIQCIAGFPPLGPYVAITGVSGTGAIQSITVSSTGGGSVELSGVSGTGAIQSLTIAGQRNVTAGFSGVSGTGAISSLDVIAGASGNATAGFSGLAGTGTLGTLLTAGQRNVSAGLSGVSGTGTVATIGISVNANGTVTLSGVSGTGDVGTVAATTGSAPVAVSDDFYREDGGLGSNWTTISNLTAPSILANNIYANADKGAYWSTNVFANDQYAKAYVHLIQYPTAGVQKAAGPAVRISPSEQTYYWVSVHSYMDGEGYYSTFLTLWRCVNGTYAQLSAESELEYSEDNWIKIEASGTTIRVLTSASENGTYTQRISATDSTISEGYAGFVQGNFGGPSFDNWSAGDL